MVSICDFNYSTLKRAAKRALSMALLFTFCFTIYEPIFAKGKNPVDTAESFFDKKQYKKAKNILNDYLKIYPGNRKALYVRARCYEALAFDKLAIKDLSKLIEMKHNEYKYRKMRGKLYVENGLADKAIDDFKFALKTSPKDHFLWNQLALAYRITKQREKAIDCYSKLIEISGPGTKPYDLRARMYQIDKVYDKAIKDYTMHIAQDRPNTKSLVQRGICYFDIGEYTKAEADFSSAIDLGHISVDPLIMRAKVYDKLGKKNLAAKDRKAARVDDFEIPYHGR